jgi:hypothetical protein
LNRIFQRDRGANQLFGLAAQILPHQQQRRRLGVLMVKARLIQSIQHPQESCESLRLIFSARKSQLLALVIRNIRRLLDNLLASPNSDR